MVAVMQSDLVRRHRLTVEEYFRMAEIGLLAPEARVELIEGEIFDMAPIGNVHGGHTAEAGHYIHTSFTSTPGRVPLRALPGTAVDLTGLFED